MRDKKSNESRRKLLKSIAAASGAVVAGKNLPESWKRPVVDSVVLPAHALTSPCTIAGTYCAFVGGGPGPGGEPTGELTIVVSVGGTVDIIWTRMNNSGPRTWYGQDTVSPQGGDFNITATRASGGGDKLFTGTITWCSNSIVGRFANSNVFDTEYTAIPEICADFVLDPVPFPG